MGEDFSEIANASKGLITFGTPHAGSNFSSWFDPVLNVVNILLKRQPARAPYVSLTRRDDQGLSILDAVFLASWGKRIYITSFYENKPDAIGVLFNSRLVSRGLAFKSTTNLFRLCQRSQQLLTMLI